MAGSGEIKAQQGTYGGFIRLLKVGTAVSVLLAIVVVLLIS